MTTLRIAIAQLNSHVGAIDKNLALIRAARAQAAAMGADLLVTPELSISGYPPEDLVLKPAFVTACEAAAEDLAKDTADGGPGIIIGTPWRNGTALHNSAFVLDNGKIIAKRKKHELPNYGVFDEKRVFAPGPVPMPVDFRGFRLGLLICEDWWFPTVPKTLAASGAELLLSINGSPFEDGKHQTRIALAAQRVAETGLPYIFAALTGGQDEIVFDGASFVLNADSGLAAQLPHFAQAVTLTEWTRTPSGLICAQTSFAPEPHRLELIYQAMMMGLRDYVNKNGFPGIVLGLSGGIDSAISAAVAADALGPERVRAVMLPSPYTSTHSLEDAAACANMLGIPYETIPISGAMDAFATALAPAFTSREPDITEENLQSRTRGLILMALSNKFGPMLLTTGNKSEMSVGYATLYGDMCGGYSVLKDIYKTTVFELSRWRNAHTPPYDLLDAILHRLIEGEASIDDVVSEGFERATVLRIWKLLDRAEYKRRQAPPGVKISLRAFGRDRRYPMTNGFTNLIK